MFDDFIKNCAMENKLHISDERIEAQINSVMARVKADNKPDNEFETKYGDSPQLMIYHIRKRSPLKTIIPATAVAAAAAIAFPFVAKYLRNDRVEISPEGNGAISSAKNVDPIETTSENSEAVSSTQIIDGEIVNTSPDDTDGESMTESVFEAVDPVDDRIRYTVDLSNGNISYHKTSDLAYEYTFEDSTASLAYLREFFGNDRLPVDEAYKEGFQRNVFNASYSCKVSPDAKAYSPVDGVVVAVDDNCGSPLGNAVAVEFGDKVFIIAHLDEVSVKVGEKVSVGQILGVCGGTGSVAAEDAPVISLITMRKM